MKLMYLKSLISFGIVCGLVVGMPFLVLGTDALTMESDTDRPGFDYKNFWLEGDCPECCRDACANDPKCKAFTYVKPGVQGAKARCWLKHTVSSAKKSTCCVSGVKMRSPSSKTGRVRPPGASRKHVKQPRPGIYKESTREMAIKSLMADPASRSTLKSLSSSAGMTPDQLTTKTLQGNSVSRIMEGQGIEGLPWDVGVKISLTKHNPAFFDFRIKKYVLVGIMSYSNVELSNRKTFLPNSNAFDYSWDLKDHIENDIFKTTHVRLNLKLPHRGAYIITVTSREAPRCRLFDKNGERKLSMVRSKTRHDWVCLTTINPEYSQSFYDCVITVTPSKKLNAWGTGPDWIGGFIITRL